MKTGAHVPFVNLRAQHEALAGDLQAAFNRVMEASSFILGPSSISATSRSRPPHPEHANTSNPNVRFISSAHR
jgi:hypothetical protein